MGGEVDKAPGEVEIRIPQHIFYDRDGNGIGTVTVPLSLAPTEEGTTGFNYYIDAETDEIVIKNFNTITAAYFFTCQVKYSFTPFAVKDGFTNDALNAKFTVQTADGEITTSADSLTVMVDTGVKIGTSVKQFIQKYEKWQSAWGKAPADANDYFYVKWKLRTSIDGKTTQPYTLTFNDNTGTYGTIIGWGPISTNIFVSGTAENFNNYIFYQRDKTTPYPTNVDYLDGYVFVKYPRSMLETTTDITNSFTATMNGIDGETSSSTASKNYTYVAVNFNYQGDNLKVIKANNLQLSGAMDVLQLGRDFSSSATYFSMYVNNRGWSLTNNDQDAYQTVLEDNLLFIDNK